MPKIKSPRSLHQKAMDLMSPRYGEANLKFRLTHAIGLEAQAIDMLEEEKRNGKNVEPTLTTLKESLASLEAQMLKKFGSLFFEADYSLLEPPLPKWLKVRLATSAGLLGNQQADPKFGLMFDNAGCHFATPILDQEAGFDAAFRKQIEETKPNVQTD